jgi:hypothetical protein
MTRRALDLIDRLLGEPRPAWSQQELSQLREALLADADGRPGGLA